MTPVVDPFSLCVSACSSSIRHTVLHTTPLSVNCFLKGQWGSTCSAPLGMIFVPVQTGTIQVVRLHLFYLWVRSW